ncbi:MAG TPA: GIY-YIG nuclease family protein [Methanothrix sp.]|nr:GIY-YIG nuclease family protein [Methanothrix sp.]HPT20166.1 GIY-YIG nuclease family protein [Methanothrix sp.]
MHILVSPESLPRISEPGIYTLLLSLPQPRRIKVGSLGLEDYPAGYYCYTGSARGPGGLKRIDRHIMLSRGQKKTRRWHIDYLLPWAGVLEVYITLTALDLECRIASDIGREMRAVPGFGCTDCRCASHLHYAGELSEMKAAAGGAHQRAEALLGQCQIQEGQI